MDLKSSIHSYLPQVSHGPMDFLICMIAERNYSYKRHTYLESIFYFPQQNLGGSQAVNSSGKMIQQTTVRIINHHSAAPEYQALSKHSCADPQYFPFTSLPLFPPCQKPN